MACPFTSFLRERVSAILWRYSSFTKRILDGSSSPRLTLSSQSMMSATSFAPRTAPVVSSPGAVGTREETSISILYGRRFIDCSIALSPCSPATFAISIKSAHNVVVPWGTTTEASASGESMVDSKCIWASISPGSAYCPLQSSTRSASRIASGSMDTILLFLIYIFVGYTSPENTFTSFTCSSFKSQGCIPRPVSIVFFISSNVLIFIPLL